MSKLSKEELARFQGAAWALRMVEEKGLEATQKDLEQRGIRRLPLACKKQDIREFEQYEKKNTLATVLMMTCMTLYVEKPICGKITREQRTFTTALIAEQGWR